MGNNIVMILLMIIGGSAGIFFHTVHFDQSAGNHYPKFIRKARYGYKLTD